MNLKNLFLASIIGCSAISCTSKKETTNATVDSLAVADSLKLEKPVEALVYKDTALDYQARFIAGLNQTEKNSFTSLEGDNYWKDYKTAIDTGWQKMYNNRLSKMKEWEAGTLSSNISDTLSLFYPFSGPDFLHARKSGAGTGG